MVVLSWKYIVDIFTADIMGYHVLRFDTSGMGLYACEVQGP